MTNALGVTETWDKDMKAGTRHRIMAGWIVSICLVRVAAAQTAMAPVEAVTAPMTPSSPGPAAVAASYAASPGATDANRLDTPEETLPKAGAVIRDLAAGDVHDLRRGPLLIHGNYCGIGGRRGLAPVDALDAACRRHDACTRSDVVLNCTCDERLEREAVAVADDPAELKTLATATAASMAILVYR